MSGSLFIDRLPLLLFIILNFRCVYIRSLKFCIKLYLPALPRTVVAEALTLARATVRAAARTGVATVGTKTFAATDTADGALTRLERRSDLRFHGIADIIFSAVRELTENHCYVYRFHHPVTTTLNTTVNDCPTASDGRGNPTAGLNAGLGAPSIVTEFATNEVKVGIGSKKVSDVASTLPVLLTTLV